METGKNPGLGIRNLHKKGITGKGVNIAIVDYTLLLEHEEYSKQIKYYGKVNCDDMASMHGPLVSSISVGKSCGVAPDAGLYFVASNNVTTENNKRVIDYTHFAVVSCNLFETYGFWTYSLDKDSYSDPDSTDSYKAFEWDSWINLVPNIDGFGSYYEK